MQAIWRHLLAEYWSTLGQHVGSHIERYLIDMLSDYWLTCQPSVGWRHSAECWSSYWPTCGWTDGHIDCIMANIMDQ